MDNPYPYESINNILTILLRVQYENHVPEEPIANMMNALARATS